MNKKDLLNNFRGLAGELMESIRGDQQTEQKKPAPKKAAPAKVAPKKAASPKKPISPHLMQDLIRHGIVLLLVIICCFSVIFASCAKAEPAPADGGTPIESAAPAVTPAL